MNAKEKLKNDILVGMRTHLDINQMSILEAVIANAIKDLEITELETLPSTIDNTNKYILELFMVRKASKLKKSTVDAYLNTLKEFTEFTNKPLNKISESDIECFLYHKRQLKNNNVSLNNQKRNLSAFFTWMRKVKLINDNPCDGVESYDIIEKPIDHLEPTDIEKIKEGCKNCRDRAIIEFMRSTAMRRGEIPQVRICDIDFNSGKLVILGHKSGRYRTVFLDKVAIHYIREYLAERNITEQSNEPLFTHTRGEKGRVLEPEGIYAAIKKIAKRSGIDKNVYPHIYRKTTATQIVRRGGSEDAAGEYLGHAPKSVTGKHYTYKSDQYVEQIFHNYVEAV